MTEQEIDILQQLRKVILELNSSITLTANVIQIMHRERDQQFTRCFFSVILNVFLVMFILLKMYWR